MDTEVIQRKACLIDFDKSSEAIRKRTDSILKKELDGKDEFTRLHAILCMTHGWENNSSIAFSNFIDTGKIAKRLDEIRSKLIS